MAIQVHFYHRHVQDNVIILEEGNLSQSQCPRCNIMVPWQALNGRHLAIAQCAKGAEIKRRRMEEEELRESREGLSGLRKIA